MGSRGARAEGERTPAGLRAWAAPDAYQPEGRSIVCSCDVCGAPTKRGKPWCTEHFLLQSAYAQAVAGTYAELVRAAFAPVRAPIPEVLLREVEQVTRGLMLGRAQRVTAGRVARRLGDPTRKPSEERVAAVWRALGWRVARSPRGVYSVGDLPVEG